MSSVIKINRSSNTSGLRISTINDSSKGDVNGEEEHWNRKIEHARKSAYEEGRNDALLELENQFSKDLFVKYGEFENLANSLELQFKEYEKAFEKIVVNFSISIAEKLIRKKMDEESVIATVISEASQKVLGADKVLIKVNPTDYELLKDSGRELFRDESFTKVQFEPDSKVDKGGCVIESEIGNVDAKISTQLNEIAQKISNNFLNDQS